MYVLPDACRPGALYDRKGKVGWSRPVGDDAYRQPAFHLAINHPYEICIQRFDAHTEARTGADWQWWFRDRYGYAGFRVQAKRAKPSTGRFDLKQLAPPSEGTLLQAEMLEIRAERDGLAGLYSLYTDRQPSQRCVDAPTGPCPHGPLDPMQWCCSLLLVQTALRHARHVRTRADAVLGDHSRPWYHLVCDGYGQHGGLTQVVHAFLQAVASDLIPPRDRGFAAIKRDERVSVGRPARRVGHSLVVAETGGCHGRLLDPTA